ncbi:MAG: hypothetical protein JNN27_01865 [Planctomycetes bacterium]|nr:hypothetical protein [Planctomycetota bacterium]
MSHVLALVRQQLRESRTSFVLAALATSAAIGFVHAWFPGPAAVSEAAALAIGVLAALWTLYFASDSFAGDSASGRLATLSVLPVSSRALWASRLCFVACASLAQLAWAIVVGYGCQLALGDARSLAHFENGLDSYAPWAFALPVLASAGMLASLVVDSALSAMVSSLLLLGGLAAVLAPLTRAFASIGVDLRLSAGEALAGAVLFAFVLFMLGAFSFARGQHRLGARRVRAFHAAWPLGALVCVAGIATAAEHRRRVAVELDSPSAKFHRASASIDGSFLALPVWHDLSGNQDPPPNVWLLDLDTGRRELLARPGQLILDRYLHYSLPWSFEKPQHVLQINPLDFDELKGLLELRAGVETWSVSTLSARAGELPSWLVTRAVPAWASVDWERDAQGVRSTIVRWSERGIERRFTDTIPLRGVLPTAVVGRVLRLREQALVHHDLQSGSEQLVLQGATGETMWPSPSGGAVLVSTEDARISLDASTGAVLHTPWPSEEWSVAWIDSNDDARAVELRAIGVPDAPSRILDLETGVEFEVERERGHGLLLRIAQRGYVFVRADGDLVLVDLQGRLVKVLVER